uniref:ABC transporter substrate-binding protein n=1 Tax=Fundidesulfovibrio putealis TaxID=270496 RepID=A0A7C4ENC6_9BACT
MHSLFAILAAAVCFAASTARAEPLRVMVSIEPQKYFVEKIAGPLVRAEVMAPPGADVHTYEPKPSRMVKVAGAVLYFAQGVDFERTWLPRLARNSKDMVVVDTLAGVDMLPLSGGHGDGHGHKEEGKGAHGRDSLDPHVWTSPRIARILAANIAMALVKADPANEPVYRANLAAFEAEAEALDARIRDILRDVPPGSEFIVFHPAWAYFARDYGLKEVTIESGGREPGPRQLAELIEHARETRAKVVFVQPQFSKKAAQTVASAIGARLVEADPLAGDWPGNLAAMAQALAEALRP